MIETSHRRIIKYSIPISGAHDRDRTGEPHPYQGCALPTELRGQGTYNPLGNDNLLFISVANVLTKKRNR